MYKIIGADGKEYGPVTAEQLKQWIAEGRVNQQTRILTEGGTEWKTLAQIPELAAQLPISAPPAPAAPAGIVPAADLVNGPAVGLIVTAILGFIANVIGIFWNLFASQMSMPAGTSPELDQILSMFSGTMGVIGSVVAILVAGLILVGALKMKRLESHGWAVTASVLALVPCISPCCFVGLPVGIWALVVLTKPEVKSAFP